MDLRYLRYFIVVAEELNFSRAAERLHTAQPSLSNQIRSLEEIVGTPLFYRNRHRVELSTAGHAFLEEARRIVQDVEFAMERTRKIALAEAGRLSIGFIPGTEVAVFPHVLTRLRQEYPGLQCDLVTGRNEELIDALQRGIVNVILHGDPIDDPQIASEVVIYSTPVVVLLATNPLAKLQRIPPERLVSEPFIQPKNPGGITIINEIAARAGISLRPMIDSDGVLATISAVASGLGFAIMPNSVFLPPMVVARPLDIVPQPKFPVYVAYRRDHSLLALEIFLRLLREGVPKDEITILDKKSSDLRERQNATHDRRHSPGLGQQNSAKGLD
jgi:LysR family hca operon transcriptional activator